MAQSGSNRSKMWIWVVATIVVLLVAWNVLYNRAHEDDPPAIGPYESNSNPFNSHANPFDSPPPGGSYYENPAPGDDGSYDCPPGGGPVYVGSNDPAGLDGDGDSIGCE
jgi:hypothetical protein